MKEIKSANLQDLYIVKNDQTGKYKIGIWSKGHGTCSGTYAMRELAIVNNTDNDCLIMLNKHLDGTFKSISDVLLEGYSNVELSFLQTLNTINIHSNTLQRWIELLDTTNAQHELQIMYCGEQDEKVAAHKIIKNTLLMPLLIDYSALTEEAINASQDGAELGSN